MSKYLDTAKQILKSKKPLNEQKHDLIRDLLRQLNTSYPVELFEFVVNTPELVNKLNTLEAAIHKACIDDTVTPEKFRNEQIKGYLDLHIKAYEEFKNKKTYYVLNVKNVKKENKF